MFGIACLALMCYHCGACYVEFSRRAAEEPVHRCAPRLHGDGRTGMRPRGQHEGRRGQACPGGRVDPASELRCAYGVCRIHDEAVQADSGTLNARRI